MKKAKRLPKHMGTGIYVHQQFSASQLVKGDTFNDADFGDMVWDGRKWIAELDWDAKQWDIIQREWQYYSLRGEINRMSFIDYLIEYYHSPKRNHRK